MPRKRRVVGSNPNQGSSFFFEGCSRFVELFALALLITSLMTYAITDPVNGEGLGSKARDKVHPRDLINNATSSNATTAGGHSNHGFV